MDPEAVFFLYESQVSILAKQVQDKQYTKLSVCDFSYYFGQQRYKNEECIHQQFMFFSKEKGLLIFSFG